VRYISHKPDQTPLVMRIRDLAATRTRYGYFRIYILLRREGWVVNHKRVYRLYRNDGLSLRLKKPKRNVSAANRERQPAALAANQMWSMDFVSNALFDGRRLRALTVVDAFTREAVAIDVDQGIKGEQVVQAMARISSIRGAPKTIRVDNGPEFISKALDRWAYENGVTLDFSRPGKPTDTDVVEKPFQAGAGIFFSDPDLARGLVRHRAVKSAYASSAFSTRTVRQPASPGCCSRRRHRASRARVASLP
jgi:putative transposase